MLYPTTMVPQSQFVYPIKWSQICLWSLEVVCCTTSSEFFKKRLNNFSQLKHVAKTNMLHHMLRTPEYQMNFFFLKFFMVRILQTTY